MECVLDSLAKYLLSNCADGQENLVYGYEVVHERCCGVGLEL